MMTSLKLSQSSITLVTCSVLGWWSHTASVNRQVSPTCPSSHQPLSAAINLRTGVLNMCEEWDAAHSIAKGSDDTPTGAMTVP